MTYTADIRYRTREYDMHYTVMQSKYTGRVLKSAVIIFMSCCLLIFSGELLAKQVKMSKSKICHDSSSPYYSRTKNFTAFETLEACLAAGGRLPKGSIQNNKSNVTKRVSSETSQSYSRSAFAHWTDDDGDCLNTRHELLQDLSTGPVTMSENGCRVLRGHWNDPYSGNVLFDSSKMDIDTLYHWLGLGNMARIHGQMQSDRSSLTTPSIFLQSQLALIEVKAQKAPVIGYHQIKSFIVSTSLDIYA